MVHLASLWLPIVLSAVFVFLASTVIHMTPLWHKSDFPKMAREPEVLAALRPLAIPPGDYFLPRAEGMKEMRTPEFKDKLARGPVMVMTVLPNGMMINMNRSLAQWYVFLLVVGCLVALAASRSVTPALSMPQIAAIPSSAIRAAFSSRATSTGLLTIRAVRKWA